MKRSTLVFTLGILIALAWVTGCSGQTPMAPTPTSAAPLSSPQSAPTLDIQTPILAPTAIVPPTPTPEPAASPTAITSTPAVSPTATVATPAATTAGAGGGGTAAPGSTCTDVATFVADVTIPDKTVIAPGDVFTKTWRLRNTGTCTWQTGYTVVFATGQAMSQATRIAVPETAPHATADVTVSMTAPMTAGTFQSFWELRGPKGVRFGPQVWALIVVPGAPAAAPALEPSALTALGVYATRLQTDPAKPGFGEPIGFRVSMRNTNSGPQTLRWFVKLYQCTETPCSEDQLKASMSNLDRSFGESTAVESTLLPGTSTVEVPAHWVAGAGACVYTAVPHYYDPSVLGIVPLPKPDGVPLYYTFDVCQ